MFKYAGYKQVNYCTHKTDGTICDVCLRKKVNYEAEIALEEAINREINKFKESLIEKLNGMKQEIKPPFNFSEKPRDSFEAVVRYGYNRAIEDIIKKLK